MRSMAPLGLVAYLAGNGMLESSANSPLYPLTDSRMQAVHS